MLEVKLTDASSFWPNFHLQSISLTLYEQLLSQDSFGKKLQNQIVSREKLPKDFCLKNLLVKHW
jgi:hypothetical protein